MEIPIKNMAYWKVKNSPAQKKIWPPTKGYNTLEYEEGLREAKAKAIADEKAKYKAGKITKKELDGAIDEISRYVDF